MSFYIKSLFIAVPIFMKLILLEAIGHCVKAGFEKLKLEQGKVGEIGRQRETPGSARVNTDTTAVLPGAILFALIWVGATAIFGAYVSQINDYNATYGSLGAVVILLTWFYLSAYVLLLGGEFVQAREERN